MKDVPNAKAKGIIGTIGLVCPNENLYIIDVIVIVIWTMRENILICLDSLDEDILCS